MVDAYSYTSLEGVILTVFAIVVIVVLAGCLYAFFRAIFFFIFSGGKEEQKKKGWNSIRFMVIGVILCIGLLISFPYVIKSMNVELSEEYSTKQVFNKAGELFKKIFEVGSMVKDAQKENEFRGQLYYDINSETPNGEGYDL
ncbi:hypothetical protein P148_SR1C00001G0180 [candidate division SR1 bacterium RAAC1_SR1_1]|nr:hypothetical protein P148_SR1C00001G0180 [candidate division SR1 bacterium RAAC1_SR1_1]